MFTLHTNLSTHRFPDVVSCNIPPYRQNGEWEGYFPNDVESAEEIVCATIDFNKVHSKFVSYETESSPSSRPECKKRLETLNYSFVKMYGDALFRGPKVGPADNGWCRCDCSSV